MTPVSFKAIFFIGGPGSGKSSIERNLGLGALGLKHMDVDDIRVHMLQKLNLPVRFDKMSPEQTVKRDEVRMQSREKNEMRERGYTQGKLGLLISCTGREFNRVSDQKDRLEDAGYDTFLIFIESSLEACLQRNRQRGAHGGRQLTDGDLTRAWQDTHSMIPQYKSLFGSDFVRIENTKPIAENQEFLGRVYSSLVRFVKAPITNPAAVEWMRAQRGY